MFYKITYVYAELEERNTNINAFKNKEYDFIVSTSVLERGITIIDVNVIVYASLKTFSKESLIQMVGRVGRNILNPSGEVYILTNHFDKDINSAVKEIKSANEKMLVL